MTEEPHAELERLAIDIDAIKKRATNLAMQPWADTPEVVEAFLEIETCFEVIDKELKRMLSKIKS